MRWYSIVIIVSVSLFLLMILFEKVIFKQFPVLRKKLWLKNQNRLQKKLQANWSLQQYLLNKAESGRKLTLKETRKLPKLKIQERKLRKLLNY